MTEQTKKGRKKATKAATEGNSDKVAGMTAKIPTSILAGLTEAAKVADVSELDLRAAIRARADHALEVEFATETPASLALAFVEAERAKRQQEFDDRIARLRGDSSEVSS